MLDLGSTVLLQSNSLNGNKSTGILWAEAFKGVHAGLFLTVQVALRRRPGEDVSCSFVDHHVHCTVNVLLAEQDGIFWLS